ncbi:hypothetical protein KIS1582_0257 [Cytobacillus firmus]|uniref:Uncharacterized protein n=1 Tax=Cytobacillus firmus TaxID=1399 RepID=A0A800NGR3_CYTFI|nr:hypothetical protein KIS1582_0257 [Cytobacillus firmus]
MTRKGARHFFAEQQEHLTHTYFYTVNAAIPKKICAAAIENETFLLITTYI